MNTNSILPIARAALRRLFLTAGLLATLGATVATAKADIPRSLQGNYQIQSVTITVNGTAHDVALTEGAAHAVFPVTPDGWGWSNHLGIYKQLGLDLDVDFPVTTDLTASAPITGDTVTVGDLVITVDSGTLTGTLSSAGGGTLTYDAEISGHTTADDGTETDYTVSVTVVLTNSRPRHG